MKLKEKILLKAVALFNEQGVSNVSPNQIAAALEISTGNLTYHYKTKAVLVEEICRRMHTDSLDYITVEGYLSLDDFRKIMLKFQQLQNKYSFFFNDMVFINRNYRKAAELYETTNLKRFERGIALLNYYIDTGRMIPESEGIDYRLFIYNIWMVSTFWSAQSQIITTDNYAGKPADLVNMTWKMLFPYLTEKGKEEYFQIEKYLKSVRVKEEVSQE